MIEADKFTLPYSLNVPVSHLDEYFGLWAILEEPFRAIVNRCSGMDLTVHINQQKEAKAAADKAKSEQIDPNSRDGYYGYEVALGNVAIIPIQGPMMKYASSLSGGTGMVRTRRRIRNAVNDTQISAIMLHIDSPGGSVRGLNDLVADIEAAAGRKPTQAFIEDLGASAAYEAASATNKIWINASGWAGSIGTYAVIEDYSQYAENLGVRVHVIRPDDGTSALKGMGAAGTEITEEQLSEWTRIVTGMNEFFLKQVAKGRSLSMKRVKELATGQVWVAAEAAERQLVDGLKTFDQAVSDLSRLGARKQMSTNASTPDNDAQAATLEELEANLLGASSDFILGQMKKKATLAQAKDEWMLQLASDNERLEKERAEADAKAKADADAKAQAEADAEKARKDAEDAKAKAGRPGVDPVSDTPAREEESNFDDPVAEWNAEVAKVMETSRCNRRQACIRVAAKNPALRAAMIREHNRDNGRQTVGDKYADSIN